MQVQVPETDIHLCIKLKPLACFFFITNKLLLTMETFFNLLIHIHNVTSLTQSVLQFCYVVNVWKPKGQGICTIWCVES